MTFKVGDIVKNKISNRVIRVKGITGDDLLLVPEGWIIDKDECYVNPEYCEHYNGATSVLGDI